MNSILLVDDDAQLLGELTAALGNRLGDQVEIRTWIPAKDDNPQEVFGRLVDADTKLVITDHDLTKLGQTGLFGASIVNWSQARFIPVGDFSRGNVGAIPKESELFELRVPTRPAEAAGFVVTIYRGFSAIDEALAADAAVLSKQSPASVLAGILGVPSQDSQFALYSVRLGTASGALMDQLASTAPPEIVPTTDQKIKLLSYIVGHLLLNSVLRFAGPILSMRALKAYVASDEADAPDVQALFAAAVYRGPFSEFDQYFWFAGVNDVLDPLIQDLPADAQAETQGEINRRALERKLGRDLRRHACPRCQGLNGGSFCPFTKRTVCIRKDCSVGPNTWIPGGAKLCRIERDFFDEWAPILGL